uniref:Uncharacterized protein n=1 Tax=Quercus lobata TaxID=97700 RepID=A0A7N2MXV2_QUELO
MVRTITRLHAAVCYNGRFQQWLIEHSNFENNPIYLGSDSYEGLVTPILAQDIINGNEAGIEPHMNLKVHNLIIGLELHFLF